MTNRDLRGIAFGGYMLLGFGLLLGLLNLTSLRPALDWLIDLVTWPMDGGAPMEPQAARFMAAVLTGSISGWGILQIMLARVVDSEHTPALRRAVFAAYGGWFALDGLGSVITGAPWNVAGNILFAAILLAPWALVRNSD